MMRLFLVTGCISIVAATICPDSFRCPGNTTCCRSRTERFACCPFVDAVCCADHVHCCPHDLICSPTGCVENKNFMATNETEEVNPFCFDNQDECPRHTTCCPGKKQGHSYRCCPLRHAVCCEDGETCCPKKTTCNSRMKTCERGYFAEPLKPTVHLSSAFAKLARLKGPSVSVPALLKPALVNDVKTCPDSRYSCTDSDTCCRTGAGLWTCCGYASGTCCSDGLHCCPYGASCVQNSYCINGNITVSAEISTLAEPVNADVIVCPDKHSKCSKSQTCCQVSDTKYGCCPMPSAVCCSDRIHCCPQGYKCIVESGTCSDDINEISWYTKLRTF